MDLEAALFIFLCLGHLETETVLLHEICFEIECDDLCTFGYYLRN
jgi:hypothetical protein